MGADCLSANKRSRQFEKSPQKITKSMIINQQFKERIQDSLIQSPKKNMGQLPPTAISTSGIVQEAKTYVKHNPEDTLMSPQEKSNALEFQQQDIWDQIQNTRSSIIRLPSKVRKSPQKQSNPNKAKQAIQDFENCQTFQGQLKTERFQQRLTITNEDLDIQLLLPRCRAGPIVVPYINYDIYSIDQTEQ